MLQISDTIKQLYEWYYLKANDIKKKQKNISSDLLASFGQQLTREDIFQVDMHSISTA
jgi:predicted unusual protein kinase regulating ubiquinone biosynthesis (AarF/ABC1/UbiB family)